jgi:hypothetical protein
MEHVFTIEPPPAARMAGIAYFMPSHTPVWLTAMVPAHASSVSSTKPAMLPTMPALLTRTSSLPQFCWAKSTAAAH